MMTTSNTQTTVVLTFNVGSSSLKIAAYKIENHTHQPLLFTLNVDMNKQSVQAKDNAQDDAQTTTHSLQDFTPTSDLAETAAALFTQVEQYLQKRFTNLRMVCAHRVVHGGDTSEPMIITPETLQKLRQLETLAPLHQKPALTVVDALQQRKPNMLQVAAFDTAFHANRPKLWAEYALPERVREQGVRSYGFHGLSYQSIVRQLRAVDTHLADQRLIVAHLGSGCSITAIHNGKSINSTLGFSGLDGVPMGTRPGHLDAGVLLFLIEQGWSLPKLTQLLYKESGLLGLSGISNDLRDLYTSDQAQAQFAVEYFCAHVAQAIAKLMVSTAGVDAIVFTGGVGENQDPIREQIVAHLDYLNVKLNPQVNNEPTHHQHPYCISSSSSAIACWVVHCNEQFELLQAALPLIKKQP